MTHKDERAEPEEHGYGDDSDCLCGRNFDKVRGLREHITKARLRRSTPGERGEQ